MRKLGKRRTRLLLTAIATLIFAALAATNPNWVDKSSQIAQSSQPGMYRVVKVDDGDTIVVDMNGVDETVRFIGVDTPETHDPRKPVQCFGKLASQHTKDLIAKNRIRLQADPLNTNRDRYNRLLRYIYLPDGTLLNLKIIQDGYGLAYTYFPFTKIDEFRAAERSARESGKGLWSACQVDTKQNGARSTNPAN